MKYKKYNVPIFSVESTQLKQITDALGFAAEEGRVRRRYSSGSCQVSFDPAVSEWGNPARRKSRYALFHRDIKYQIAKIKYTYQNLNIFFYIVIFNIYYVSLLFNFSFLISLRSSVGVPRELKYLST